MKVEKEKMKNMIIKESKREMKKVHRKRWKNWAGLIIVSCFIIGAIFCLLSGGYMKKEYLKPWNKSYAAAYADPREKLCAVGILAASNHNMQPWKIVLNKDNKHIFYLFADETKLTPGADPKARQMMISQGTFLEYVRQAGLEFGYTCSIELFPDGEYDENHLKESMQKKPVAMLTLSSVETKQLNRYQDIFYPDTNRNAYESKKLTAMQIENLLSIQGDKSTGLQIFQNKSDLETISNYAIKSARVEAQNSTAMEESNKIFRANEYQKNKYRFGYSVEGQGVMGIKRDILQALLTIIPSLNSGKAASNNFIQYTKTSVDNTPAYAIITTSANSRTMQVQSGMLYSRLVLEAHRNQLVMQPLSQVLEEYPAMSELYNSFKKEYAPANGTVQMLFRLGTCDKKVPYSMREDISCFIEK